MYWEFYLIVKELMHKTLLDLFLIFSLPDLSWVGMMSTAPDFQYIEIYILFA